MISGKIYKLKNSENDFYYIGSTIDQLSNRVSKHRQDARNNKRPNNLLHKKMNEIGIDKWSYELLLQIDVNNKRELCRKEDEYIDLDDINCLNQKRAFGIYRDEYTSDAEYEKARYKRWK